MYLINFSITYFYINRSIKCLKYFILINLHCSRADFSPYSNSQWVGVWVFWLKWKCILVGVLLSKFVGVILVTFQVARTDI